MAKSKKDRRREASAHLARARDQWDRAAVDSWEPADLSYEEPTRAALNRDSLYIKRLLVYMDKPAYREFVQLRRQHLLAKKERESALPKTRSGRLRGKHRERRPGGLVNPAGRPRRT
jgi:hypothetical protein